jgi:GT2 family glycosyltransferase
MADLAVVIVSYNSAPYLEPCLTTLYEHSGGIELDVVIADNESTDGSAELVERLFPEARVLRCANRGFAYGNNRALATVTAPYVLFLNADTEIMSGTFADLVEDLRRRPQVGLVGVRQFDPQGRIYPTIRRFPTATRLFFEAIGSERFPFRARWLGERELDPRAYDAEVECDWVSGSFMLARREALLAAGLMDERFFMYCEEPDLCLRIKHAGWQVRHLPTMTIFHHWGRSGWNPRLASQDAYARRQYIAKHFSRPRAATAIAAYALGHVARAAYGAGGREKRRARRAASVSALRTLFGLDPPPFADPPEHAVAPLEDEQTTNAASLL